MTRDDDSTSGPAWVIGSSATERRGVSLPDRLQGLVPKVAFELLFLVCFRGGSSGHADDQSGQR
jgi:hypothetical protein